MKKIKFLLAIIVIGFLGLVFYQNKDFFMANQALYINLGFIKLGIPALPNIFYHFFFAFCSILIIGFLWFLSFLKSRKKIKILNATIASHVEGIASLKQESVKLDDNTTV